MRMLNKSFSCHSCECHKGCLLVGGWKGGGYHKGWQLFIKGGRDFKLVIFKTFFISNCCSCIWQNCLPCLMAWLTMALFHSVLWIQMTGEELSPLGQLNNNKKEVHKNHIVAMLRSILYFEIACWEIETNIEINICSKLSS